MQTSLKLSLKFSSEFSSVLNDSNCSTDLLVHPSKIKFKFNEKSFSFALESLSINDTIKLFEKTQNRIKELSPEGVNSLEKFLIKRRGTSVDFVELSQKIKDLYLQKLSGRNYLPLNTEEIQNIAHETLNHVSLAHQIPHQAIRYISRDYLYKFLNNAMFTLGFNTSDSEYFLNYCTITMKAMTLFF